MKTTVDNSRHVVLPFEPGDVLDIKCTGPDVLIVKRLASAAQPQLVMENGELVGVGGLPVTTEEVAQLVG